MAITPEDLLLLAKELAEREEEVSWRSSVSRAYYGIYHKCKSFGDHLPEAPYNSDPKGIHDTFIKKFTMHTGKDEFSRTVRSIGYILGSFKDIRTLADYDITNDFSHSQTQEASRYVENICRKLETLQGISE